VCTHLLHLLAQLLLFSLTLRTLGREQLRQPHVTRLDRLRRRLVARGARLMHLPQRALQRQQPLHRALLVLRVLAGIARQPRLTLAPHLPSTNQPRR